MQATGQGKRMGGQRRGHMVVTLLSVIILKNQSDIREKGLKVFMER